jgi:hypothetical protein
MLNLSWVQFPAACCDNSKLSPKNMILRGLPRRDFIVVKIYVKQFLDNFEASSERALYHCGLNNN